MTAELSAYVGHSVPGRLRIKIPSKRNDTEYFAGIRRELSNCPGVTAVDVSALTASVLVLHAADAEAIGDYAQQHGLFQVASPTSQSPSLHSQVTERLAPLNETVSGILGLVVDLRASLFAVLVGLALVQLFRGNVLSSTVTLLWYAVGAAMLAQMKSESTPEQSLAGS
jgi:hypothetical protein